MIATVAIAKKFLAQIKKSAERMFQGEITLDKKDGWLIGAILLLTGVAIGLINAPLTHGINISIASNNGNGSGCNNGNASSCNSGNAEDRPGELCKLDEEKEKVRKAIEDKTSRYSHKFGKKRSKKNNKRRKTAAGRK